MTLENRIEEVSQKFEAKKSERTKHLQDAEECMVEMNRLQGEHRLLTELLQEKVAAEEPKVSVKNESKPRKRG